MNGVSLRAGIKRAIDIIGSIVGLVVFAPVMAVAAVAIKVRMGSPILFKQTRPGLRAEPFEIIKFRTMRSMREDESVFGNDPDRVTPLGCILRRLSIDELPELINVLRGDMSLVGPRPLLVEYLPKYTPDEARRHEMRPGLTGLAQVNGGERLRFSEKLRLDVWYIDNWSLRLDARILLKTVGALVRPTAVVANVDEIDDIGLAPDRERPDRERPDPY